MRLTPFFKCPGGKRRLTEELQKRLPKDFFSKDYTYIEPFVGAGALALSILEKNPNQKIILNDANLHITNLWKAVKLDPELVMDTFDKFAIKDPLTKESYLSARDSLPKLKNSHKLSKFPLSYSGFTAGHFLFLNKNCFNGLIRFNKSGKFNSPFGQYKKTQRYNRDLILKVSEALSKVDIESKDFQTIIEDLNITKSFAKKLFFYFDPPYVPLSDTANFTSYTADGFSVYDQFRLKSVIEFLDFINVKFMISNSNSKLVKTLYKDYNISTIKASRVINSKGTKRGKISEYIITNY